jgi:hypothetical protein
MAITKANAKRAKAMRTVVNGEKHNTGKQTQHQIPKAKGISILTKGYLA